MLLELRDAMGLQKTTFLGRSATIDQTSKYQETIEALRRAEQKYRSIFENAAEGIFQTTPDGQYLSAYQNSHCEASAGDLVVLFTDGLFEVEMADDEYYGAERLLAAVCKQISLPTCQLFGQVVAEIRRSWGLTTLRLLRLSTLPPLMRWLGLRPSQQLNFFSSGQGADLGTDLEEDFLRGLQTSHNQIVLVSCSKRIGINGSGFGASPSFEVLRRAAGLFAVHPTIQDSIRFDRLSSTSTTTSTSTIDQGSKAILGKSSQENKILTDVVESGQAATKSSSSRAPMNTRGKFLTVNVL